MDDCDSYCSIAESSEGSGASSVKSSFSSLMLGIES